MKTCSRIFNFPVVNTAYQLGLSRVLRYKENQLAQLARKGGASATEGDPYYSRVAALEKKLIEENLGRMKDHEERMKLAETLADLRVKYNAMGKGLSESYSLN